MSLIQYLRTTTAAIASFKIQRHPDYQYVSLEDYVLDRGTAFLSHTTLTPEEQAILDEAKASWWDGPQIQQCYYNGQMLVLTDPSRQLRYYEGYACGVAGFPVIHGWVVLNGKVIDPTWNADGGHAFDPVWAEIPDGWEYMGVPFTEEEVRLRVITTGMAGTILDDWGNHYPVLKKERLNPLPTMPKVNHG